MTEFMTGATAWLAQHPHWIFLVVCGVAFLESFFVIGVLMPGAVMLFALAGLAGALQLPLLPLLVFAAAGAIAGDVSSFFIGRALEHGMHDRPGFRRWQPQLAAAHRFFEKWGVIGIAAGRFVGPALPARGRGRCRHAARSFHRRRLRLGARLGAGLHPARLLVDGLRALIQPAAPQRGPSAFGTPR